MGKYLSVSLLILMSMQISCHAPVQNVGDIKQVDTQKLAIVSKEYCAEDEILANFPEDMKILSKESFPDSVAFVRGTDNCANMHNVDHGGMDSWLNVTFSDGCLPNGKLWKLDSFSVLDNINLYLTFRPAIESEGGWVKIYTSYGYHLQSLRNELGLITYRCQKSN